MSARHYQDCSDAYRDDIPTRAELDAPPETWFPTGPPASALEALLDAVNQHGTTVDNTQHMH